VERLCLKQVFGPNKDGGSKPVTADKFEKSAQPILCVSLFEGEPPQFLGLNSERRPQIPGGQLEEEGHGDGQAADEAGPTALRSWALLLPLRSESADPPGPRLLPTFPTLNYSHPPERRKREP